MTLTSPLIDQAVLTSLLRFVRQKPESMSVMATFRQRSAKEGQTTASQPRQQSSVRRSRNVLKLPSTPGRES